MLPLIVRISLDELDDETSTFGGGMIVCVMLPIIKGSGFVPLAQISAKVKV